MDMEPGTKVYIRKQTASTWAGEPGMVSERKAPEGEVYVSVIGRRGLTTLPFNLWEVEEA